MGRKNKGVVAVSTLFLALSTAAVAGYGYVRVNDVLESGNSSVNSLKQHIINNTREGYVAITSISAGEVISDAMVVHSSAIASSVDQSLHLTSADIGKVATVDIPLGMPILLNMVSEDSASDLQERECSFIWLNTNLVNNDVVDVRILFPNGEDYVVAAKKAVKNVNIPANNMFLWLTEEEIQLLDAAIVDANLHNARIYVTKYVNPSVQEATEPTYEPNSAVMDVIRESPNIVASSARALSLEARGAMEKRLLLFEKAYPDFELDTRVNDMGGFYDNGELITDEEPQSETVTSDEATEGFNEAMDDLSEVEFID